MEKKVYASKHVQTTYLFEPGKWAGRWCFQPGDQEVKEVS